MDEAGQVVPAPGGDLGAELTPPPPFGIGDAIAAYLVALGGSIFASVLWVLLTDNQGIGLIVAASAGLWLGFLGGPLYLSRTKGTRSLNRDFGFRGGTTRQTLGGVAIGVVLQLFVVPVIYVLLGPIIDDPEKIAEPARELSESAGSTLGFLVLCLVVMVGAPLFEELFFRGLLQRVVTRRAGPVWGIGVSSVAFGLSHFQPLQFPALVVLGVVLGLLAQRTGGLGAGIATHAAFNAVTMIVLAALRSGWTVSV